LALLNHLTVPFNRSTCAPPLCGFPEKDAIPGSRKMCRIVLLTGRTVKAWHHMAAVVVSVFRTRGITERLRVPWLPGGLAVCASHRMPQIVLASRCGRSAPSALPPTRGQDWLRSSRPPPLGLPPEDPSHVDRHRFVKKSRAHVEMENSLPLAGTVSGFPVIPASPP